MGQHHLDRVEQQATKTRRHGRRLAMAQRVAPRPDLPRPLAWLCPAFHQEMHAAKRTLTARRGSIGGSTPLLVLDSAGWHWGCR
jgi:hypothetical protein